MNAPITIIIPCLNSSKQMGPCLGSLWEGFQAGLLREVIFADGGSQDEIAEVAEETGAVLIRSNAGRGVQMRAGADAAKGNWLFFIHSDTVLTEGWAEVVKDHIQTSNKAGYARLKFDVAGLAPQLVAAWANFRSRVFGLPYGDQTLLIKRQLFDSVGGFPAIELMEDVAIARKLRGKKRMLAFTAITSAGRYQKHGWARQSVRNFGTLVLYLFGKDPATLRKRYER